MNITERLFRIHDARILEATAEAALRIAIHYYPSPKYISNKVQIATGFSKLYFNTVSLIVDHCNGSVWLLEPAPEYMEEAFDVYKVV